MEYHVPANSIYIVEYLTGENGLTMYIYCKFVAKIFKRVINIFRYTIDIVTYASLTLPVYIASRIYILKC